MTIEAALALALGYLLGSFPTALLVGRRFGHDPTAEGSGNPGASNVFRVAGRRAGLLTFTGDLAKGAAAAALGYALGGRPLAFAAGFCAVGGHVVPPWGTRGGKGVATSAGMLVVLFPLVGVAVVATWFVLARVVGKASLASLVGALLFPVGVAVIGRPAAEVAAVAGLSLFIVVRHAPNILRLLRGEERSLRPTDR